MAHDEDGGDERTPSGSPVYRHAAPPERTFTPAAEPAETREELEAHIARHFGEPDNVLHEILSELIHLDVHLIRPTPERDHWTLFTTGMSDRPMSTPQGASKYQYAELMLKLPSSWPVDLLQVTPPPPDLEAMYWPIRWLKQLARFPHEADTWLGFGHTLPNGDPPEPFVPETKLCAFLLLPPLGVPEDVQVAQLSDGRRVYLYVLHALHLEELNLKLNRGTDALLDAFDRAAVSEVLDLRRPSSVRRKLFGLF
jgi:hypothetical protein